MKPDAGHPHDPHAQAALYPKPRLCARHAADNDRHCGADHHPFTPLGAALGVVALPAAYFAYLIPCILLYMVLATSLKKAYVRHYGELL